MRSDTAVFTAFKAPIWVEGRNSDATNQGDVIQTSYRDHRGEVLLQFRAASNWEGKPFAMGRRIIRTGDVDTVDCASIIPWAALPEGIITSLSTLPENKGPIA